MLTTINRNLSVYNNDALLSLGNFPNLNIIGKGSANVPSEDGITTNVSIVVENNPQLSDCCLLYPFLDGNALDVSGSIHITNNSASCRQENLSAVHTGDIELNTQTEVDEFASTFACKTQIMGDVSIIETNGTSDPIMDLSFFSNINTITGSLVIQNNTSLTHIGSFDSLTQIGRGFEIRTNASLTHTGHFPLLNYIEDRYLIFDNDVLETANGLPALDSLDHFLIFGNAELKSAGSYPSLQYISTNFRIGDIFNDESRPNPKLVDIGNYPMLTTIGKDFDIYDNDSLKTLGNFGALRTIGGYFRVKNNANITTLTDFSGLIHIGTKDGVLVMGENKDNVSIVIENNEQLSACCIIDNFLQDGPNAVEGEILITDNSEGCSSETEIVPCNLVVTLLSKDSVSENESIGTAVGVFSTTEGGKDTDDTIYFYTLGNNADGLFTISDDTLKTAKEFDFESETSYMITVTTNHSNEGILHDSIFTITINNVNEPPTAISLTNTTVSENEPIGTLVDSLSTVDDDIKNDEENASDSHVYTLGGTDGGSFSINDDHALLTSTSFDFETKSSYEITITSRDRGGLMWTQTFTIAIRNSNDAPTDITLSENMIEENKAPGTLIGTLSSTDPDVDLHTYSLKNDSITFQIIDNELQSKIPLNHEINPSQIITIISNDGQGGIFEKEFTISILDVNDIPTAITLSNDTINENVAIGTLVGTLTTIDEDQNENHRYELSGVDSASFRIAENNRLETNAPFDYETKTNYELTITTTDDGDSSWTQSFIITIENINDAPTAITLSNDTINENSAVGTIIGILSTIDPDDIDNDNEYNYTINGALSDTFQIVSDTLKTKIPLNYEEQSSYVIQITTDDGQGGIYDSTFVISVKDANDAPTAITLSNDTINENVAIGTLVGTLTTIDEDQNENHRYELSGMDSASFRIAENNRLETHVLFDYETKTNYELTITSTDDGDSSWIQNFIITIENTNDAPTAITLSNDTINENVAIGTLIGTLTTMDEDDTLMKWNLYLHIGRYP